MKSWIMTVWLANHDKSEWPDLPICQSDDACHVTETEIHPSKDVIEKMCSDEFFAKHKYKYVKQTSGATGGEEDDSEVKENLDRSPVYHDKMYMSVERSHKRLAVNQVPKKPDDNEAGYPLSSVL